MLGFNGGLIGKDRSTTSAASVPGVWTPGEQIKAQRSLLWPPNFIPDDPSFSNVSLLLYGDGANGSTNFVDSSSNAFAVTPSGNAQISTTQSKFGGASIYCPTSAYLTAPSSTKFQFGTGDFTIEFWVYLTGSGSLFSSALSSLTSTTLNCRLYSSGVLDIYTDGGAEYLSISSAVSPSTWTHLAFSRSGTTMRVFKDGNLIGSNTNWSNNLSSTEFYLNTGRDGSGEKYYDDLRITKGVARYTTNFTPPTASFSTLTPGEPYFYNTSLLLRGNGTNGSTTFTDSSNNNFTLTPSGNAQISTAQSKYGGSSMYFDGTGDYLSVASNNAFVFGTGDFTIEFWIKTTATVGGLVTRIAGGAGNWDLVLNVSNIYFQSQYFSTNLYNRSATSILDDNWHHVAVCRSGTSHRLFFDGIQQGATVTDATNYNGTGETRIGSDGYGDFNGYIDDLRITKGVARYTANFTPPGAL